MSGQDRSGPVLGRRRLVASVGALAGAAALGGCTRDRAAAPAPAQDPSANAPSPHELRSFHGARQAGVDDVPQAFLTLVALDLAEGADTETVRRLMTVLSDDIERLMSGRGTLTDVEPELAERPTGLSVTVGWGPATFAAAGAEPPAWLKPLPAFSIDALQDRWSGGDVVLQVCGENPVTVAHAVRRLVTGSAPMARQRWVQRGFRDPDLKPGETMRNLLGQLDGTVNPRPELAEDEAIVWDDGSVWRRDATALVVRRIEMELDRWDRADRVAREHTIGRRLDTGAPLTGGDEHSPPDLSAVDEIGLPVIDTFSHMRRSMPQSPHERFLRRPYNYDDPPGDGAVSSSGLIFMAYCADPVRQFVPVQQRLAEADLLNLYTTPIGSAVFAILPGCGPGEILGGDLIA